MTLLFVSYPLVLAAITCIWRKNVCCRCVRRARTCCRESVIAAEAAGSLSVMPKRGAGVVDVHPLNLPVGRQAGFEAGGGSAGGGGRPVPVLFATPHGLHVRSSAAPVQNGKLPDNAAAADHHQVKPSGEDGRSANDDTQKCDVFGSVAALQSEDPLNTSVTAEI